MPSGTTSASTNLLTNGSFEDPAWYPGLVLNLVPGSTTLTGWEVTRRRIEDAVGWQTADGVRSLDLDGSPGAGGIMQTFATQAGITYTVSFAMAGNPGGTPWIKQMRVEAAGEFADFTFDATGKTYDNMGWEYHTWQFVATAPTTHLEFYSLQGAGSSYGPMLDNVVVTPEPAAMSLLALGCLALLRRRGRR